MKRFWRRIQEIIALQQDLHVLQISLAILFEENVSVIRITENINVLIH